MNTRNQAHSAEVELILRGRLWAFSLKPRRSVSYRFPYVTAMQCPDGLEATRFRTARDLAALLAQLPPSVAADSPRWLTTMQSLADTAALADPCGRVESRRELSERLTFSFKHINVEALAWMGYIQGREPLRADARTSGRGQDGVMEGRLYHRDGNYLGFTLLMPAYEWFEVISAWRGGGAPTARKRHDSTARLAPWSTSGLATFWEKRCRLSANF